MSYRQQHQLRRIEAGLRRADPHLVAMLGIFGRLYPDEDWPEWERVLRVPSSLARLQRAATWIMAALTAVAVAIGVLLGKAAAVAIAGPGQSGDRDQQPPRNGGADGGLRQG